MNRFSASRSALLGIATVAACAVVTLALPAVASALVTVNVESYRGASPFVATGNPSGSLVFSVSGGNTSMGVKLNNAGTHYTFTVSGAGSTFQPIGVVPGATNDDSEFACTGFTSATLVCPIAEVPGVGEVLEPPLHLWLMDDFNSVNWTLNHETPGPVPFDPFPAPLVQIVSNDGAATINNGSAAKINYVGGTGNTLFNGGSGSETVTGGGGTDKYSYATAAGGCIIASLDGVANDGLGSNTGGASTCVGPVDPASVDNLIQIDELIGGSGNDSLTGSALGETLRGGDGFDTLNGGAGADVFDAGTGGGRITYAGRTEALSITLDGVNNDGASGENDDLGDITTITAGSGNDTMNASASSTSSQFEGGDGNDTMTGGTQADGFFGGNGNDDLSTGAGNDFLVPGPGIDTYVGGADTDGIIYSDDTAGVTLSLDNVANDGEPGSNESLGTTIENITGGKGNDTLTGNSSVNNIFGGAGADTIRGEGGNDILSDGDGVLADTPGCDSINPGSGSDDIVFSGSPATCRDVIDYTGAASVVDITLSDPQSSGNGESGGSDTITQENDKGLDVIGSDLADQVTINDGHDHSIFTKVGADIVAGGSGSELIDGGSGGGSDFIDGNGGVDALSYATRSAAVSVTLGDGLNNEGETGENDVVSDMETILGGSGNDNLNGDGGPNRIEPAAGTDAVTGGGGDDTIIESLGTNTIDGGDGNDNFVAASTAVGVDLFSGGAGGDTANYSARGGAVSLSDDGVANDGGVGEGDAIGGAENLLGGSAGDSFSLNGSVTSASGAEGNDSFDAGAAPDGADVTDGGVGRDSISYAQRTAAVTVNLAGGASGAGGEGDQISQVEDASGGSAADTLNGNADPNTLLGGGGNDLLDGLGASDLLNGDAGDDRVSYANRSTAITASLDDLANDGVSGEQDQILSTESIVGGSGNDKLTGNALANILLGGAGRDTLLGLAGRDRIEGDNGNDKLTGGTGIDQLNGGKGADSIFARDRSRDRVNGGPGRDKARLDLRDFVRFVERALILRRR